MNPSLSKALLKAQGQMGKLIKDSVNPHLKNKYASLAAVIDAVRQPLTDAGVVLYQAASTVENGVLVRSMLIHGESGECIEDQLLMPVDKPTPQAIGSAITYGRRYLIMLQCGLAPDDEDDDDGNKASNRQPQQAQRPQQPVRQAPPAVNAAPRQPEQPKALPAPSADSFEAIPNATESDNAIATEAVTNAAGLSSPQAAQLWAIDGKWCSNTFHAQNRWAQIAKTKFNSKVTPANLKAVIVAFVVDCLNKPKAQIEAQPETA